MGRKRRRRVRRRASRGLPALPLFVAALLAGCAPAELPPLVETPLAGDPAVLERFAGGWYEDGPLMASVHPRRGVFALRTVTGKKRATAMAIANSTSAGSPQAARTLSRSSPSPYLAATTSSAKR